VFDCRSTKVSNVASKRKRHELQEDFEENLVAELCVCFKFPSVLWLKATCLPTILHRVTHLLQAEQLRSTIAQDIGVGCTELPPGKRTFCMIKIHMMLSSDFIT
jgi:endoribonuclease Dicer